MKVIILKKGVSQYVTKYLPQHEVDCHCFLLDCNFTHITEDNIEAFSKTREEFDAPTLATSCYRCQKHNQSKFIEGKNNSSHLLGDGMDLRPFRNLTGELDRLEEIARKHYKFVLRYKNFIHCDCRLNVASDLEFRLPEPS